MNVKKTLNLYGNTHTESSFWVRNNTKIWGLRKSKTTAEKWKLLRQKDRERDQNWWVRIICEWDCLCQELGHSHHCLFSLRGKTRRIELPIFKSAYAFLMRVKQNQKWQWLNLELSWHYWWHVWVAYSTRSSFDNSTKNTWKLFAVINMH